MPLLTHEQTRPFAIAHILGKEGALDALKDKFQDEGDPRGHIWDRSEGLTEYNGHYLSRAVFVADPETSVHLGGHNLITVRALNSEDNGNKPSGLQWSFLHAPEVYHRSNFTPEESRVLADNMGEHSEKIHAFLDHHFPHTKREQPKEDVEQFAKQYSKALTKIKFGRSPTEHINGILQGSDNTPISASGVDGILADHLEDHDDPRSLIVRQHLQAAETHADVYNAGRELLRQRLGDSYRADLPEGSLTGGSFNLSSGGFLAHTRYVNDKGDAAYSVYWNHLLPKNKRQRRERYRAYHAVLTPEEFQRLQELRTQREAD